MSRQKTTHQADDEPARSSVRQEDKNAQPSASGEESSDSGSDHDISPDTDDDITNATWKKSKKTLKRKRRATEPSAFGVTLESLLRTDAPSVLPLSLRPSVGRKRNDQKLEMKAHKVLQIERKEREDKHRITDVIGGWGGESERALRKVAQRGVVKLFNAVQDSQTKISAAEQESKTSRGTGKPSLAAPEIEKPRGKGKGKHKDNLIGRGKEKPVNKDDFFGMIRSGSTVLKG